MQKADSDFSLADVLDILSSPVPAPGPDLSRYPLCKPEQRLQQVSVEDGEVLLTILGPRHGVRAVLRFTPAGARELSHALRYFSRVAEVAAEAQDSAAWESCAVYDVPGLFMDGPLP